MLGNFHKCLAVTLSYEGGWADNRKDPGGATMKGVTLKLFRTLRPGAGKADLRAIPDATLARIYKQQFWQPIRADGLAAGVDLATFDAAVNSGPARARKWLMAAIGGPDTKTVKKLCARRLGFMRSLAIWTTFGKGWSKRVAGIEARGVAWALAGATTPAETKKALAKEAGAANAAARKRTAGAGASGVATTTGGSDALFNLQHADRVAGWILGGLLAVGIVVTAVLIVRAIIHKQRAAAYAAEAERIMA